MRARGDWNVEFGVALLGLAELYEKTLSTDRVKMYASLLSDLPIDQLREGMARAAKECKFFPTPADIRSRCESGRDDRALLAWASLADAASAVGAYGAVGFDAWTAKALEEVFGSWSDYCEMPDGPQMALKRQEFLASYRRASMSGPNDTVVVLRGICDVAPVKQISGVVVEKKRLGSGE